MTIFAEEILPTATSGTTTLTRDKYDVPGGVRAAGAFIVVKTAPIFYKYNPETTSTPTALVGYKAVADAVITVDGYDNLRNFSAISQTGSGTLYINYYY